MHNLMDGNGNGGGDGKDDIGMNGEIGMEKRSKGILWLRLPYILLSNTTNNNDNSYRLPLYMNDLKQIIQKATKSVSQSLTILVDSPQITYLATHHPRSSWKGIQKWISHVYVAATNVAYQEGHPLMDINVVFNGYCGYNAWEILDKDAVVFVTSNLEDKKELGTRKFILLPGLNIPETVEINSDNDNDDKPYDHVVLGGTFDHLHAGHKILLTMAVWLTNRQLTCGIVEPSMLTKKRDADMMEPLETRCANVRHFLKLINSNLVYNVVPISDPFGPTRTDPSCQAIVCSDETTSGCVAVNEERAKVSFRPLDIYAIGVASPDDPEIATADMQLKISSTYIRAYVKKSRGS